jgi:hypothetical protein
VTSLSAAQRRALRDVERATDALLAARTAQQNAIRRARAVGVPLRAIATEALLSHEQVRRIATVPNPTNPATSGNPLT